MTPPFSLCQKLKDKGLPQLLGDWYCDKCKKTTRPLRHGNACHRCGHEWGTAIPSLSQMVEALEGLGLELDFQYSFRIEVTDSNSVWRVMSYDFNNCDNEGSPKCSGEIYDPNLLTALCKLYIELKE